MKNGHICIWACIYIYLLYFSFIIGFETFSPGFIIGFETLSTGFIIGFETLSSGFIIGFETSELKKCWYRNSWLWFQKCCETSQL